MKHARKFPYFCIWTIVSLCFLPTWFAAPSYRRKSRLLSIRRRKQEYFWFALISDTHIDSLQYRDKENLRAFLGVTLETVNPSFVVNLGDLTDQLLDAGSLGQRQWDDYREALSSNSAIDYFTYFDTPGNHDQYWKVKTPGPKSPRLTILWNAVRFPSFIHRDGLVSPSPP
jgi:predicted MPP superfamily phosphohydrolase